MSIVFQEKVKALEGKTIQLETMVMALKKKLDELEASRSKGTLRLPKDRVPTWPNTK